MSPHINQAKSPTRRKFQTGITVHLPYCISPLLLPQGPLCSGEPWYW